MPPRVRLTFAALSLSLLLVVAAPLYRALSRPNDIWWTPHALLVPLSQGTDRVEVYVHGKPLATLVEAGQLRIAENGGLSTLVPSDLGLRFNNWDRVRVGQLPLLLGCSALCGALACIFLLVVSGRLAYRAPDAERQATE